MFESLRSLSDSQIISGIKTARDQEHGGMMSLLGLLVETERRKIHLKLGYSSMFKYCTKALGHSEAEAMLRITAARCVMRFPAIYPLLEAREVNLSTVSRVSKILTSDNCIAVLARIRGKSMREVEAIAAEYDPTAVLPNDRVRTIVVRLPVFPAPVVTQAGQDSRNADDHLCNSGKISSIVEDSAPQNAALHLERRCVVQIYADEEFMAMLDEIRSLASHELNGNAPLQDVLKIAMRYYIKHKSPHAREARRQARAAGRAQPHAASTNRRQISVAVRDEVFERDKQCMYIGPDGRRCGSTHVLQVDHIKPVARGGASTIDNLRLLCAYHNRLEAERLMGPCDPGALRPDWRRARNARSGEARPGGRVE